MKTAKAMPIGEPQYEATRLEYARNGRAVTYGLGETWDRNGTLITNHTITYAREFRYDGARQRYLNRALGALSGTWSDYDGDQVYGDFTVTTGPPGSPPTVTEVRSFEPGIAEVHPWSSSGSADTKYYHADMIGTTREMTDSSGTGVSPVVYTAFGEKISGSAQRYGYAGAWGYQGPASDDPTDAYLQFPLLHVGARYYDPATGRFLQRDPIGIRGGLNVYAYVRNGPTIRIDPDGLQQFDVGVCVGYCMGRFAGCLPGGKNVKGIGECEARVNECKTCCGNADADSSMGGDKGPPPYGPPPATFDPWPPPPPCGCTGIEAVIVLLPLFWKQRKRRKTQGTRRQ